MLSKLADIKKTLALLLAFTPVIISKIKICHVRIHTYTESQGEKTVKHSIIYVIITLNHDHTFSDIFLKSAQRCLGMSAHPVV